MVTRGLTRTAFGKPLVQLGGNIEIISRARIDIEAMRLMGAEGRQGHGRARQTRKPASGSTWSGPGAGEGLPDHRPGHPDARRVGGFAEDPLARITPPPAPCASPTGPDEVHHMVVGRNELRQYARDAAGRLHGGGVPQLAALQRHPSSNTGPGAAKLRGLCRFAPRPGLCLNSDNERSLGGLEMKMTTLALAAVSVSLLALGAPAAAHAETACADMVKGDPAARRGDQGGLRKGRRQAGLQDLGHQPSHQGQRHPPGAVDSRGRGLETASSSRWAMAASPARSRAVRSTAR